MSKTIPRSAILGPRPAGFTLLEVLLAMTILAVVMTVIYTSFSSAGDSVERAEAVRDGNDLARTLLSRMSADIANAYCRQGAAGQFFFGKHEEIESSGAKFRFDRVALSTLTNWRRPDTAETDLWAVGYFFRERPEDGRRVLMRREKRLLRSADDGPVDEAEYELTDAVAGLQVRYWDGTKWIDDLGAEDACRRPAAAEITLTLENGTVVMTAIDVPKAQI